ncbi:4995_t:CDS:2 [Dentiscutata heterogama]|uniref:4995_t:CDS:1 n=1 Tax=Dentiscutata heterogama TaxID=1316150 RepID=A0ACA9LPM1_9GLOM|nr:4995_t:CDS:2 [Dentiscutata heterogama]
MSYDKTIFVHESKIKISVYSFTGVIDNLHEYNQKNDDDGRYKILPYIAPEVLYTKKYTYDLEIKIYNGLKPELPKHAQKLFAQMMVQCWNVEPFQRPRAIELKDNLSQWSNNGPQNSPCKKDENILDDSFKNLLKTELNVQEYDFSKFSNSKIVGQGASSIVYSAIYQ